MSIRGYKRPLVGGIAALAVGLITPAVAQAAPTCHPAPEAAVTIINASFTGGEHLKDTYSVNGPRDMTYVGGNIMAGEVKESSADVWVLQHGVMYSLSSDARRRTLLPDGRHVDALGSPSAGDEYGSAVIDCVVGR